MTKDDLYNYISDIAKNANLISEKALNLKADIINNCKVDCVNIDEEICDMYSFCNDLQDRIQDFDKALEKADKVIV